MGLLVISAVAVGQAAPSAQLPVWQMQESGTSAGLRGIDSVDGTVAWASGTGGTVLRTVDGGAHWTKCSVPDGEKDGAALDFRGVLAWDEKTAIVMASGPGEKSRLYKTVDGCGSWTLMLKNTDPDGFYDAFTFWDRKHGFLLGDPVIRVPFWQETDAKQHYLTEPQLVDRRLQKKRFLILTTNDGGTTWGYWGTDRGYFTENVAKEGAAFAASNSAAFVPIQINNPCAAGPKQETNRMWIGIGGKGGAGVLLGMRVPVDVCPQDQADGAALRFGWSELRKAHLAGGSDSSGVFSLAFRQELSQTHIERIRKTLPLADDHGYLYGVAVGGDYTKPNETSQTAAWSSDSGWTWTASAKPSHGYRSTVQWSESHKVWINAGTNGSDISRDDGRTWTPLDDGNWNALSLPYIVGPNGRIGRLNEAALPKP
jgi:hypothetical protein